MTRRKLIAGNWKLHLGPKGAAALAADLAVRLADTTNVEVIVFPTAISITAVQALLAETAIAVGMQWAHGQAHGAFTGCNSSALAREAGCTWLLAGHSEVRRDLGETDERVNASVKAALAEGLLPMTCVGETLEERQSGRLHEVLDRQLSVGLANLEPDQIATGALAYEPVWAIGTGVTASPAQAQEVHGWIRAWLRARYPAFVAEQTRILYGGSVKASNARELLSLPDVDGLLVGGASLKGEEFAAIANAW